MSNQLSGQPKSPARAFLRRISPHAVDSNSVQPSAVEPEPADASSLRADLIATAAYYLAERRGFVPGYELADWLAAEREIEREEADTN